MRPGLWQILLVVVLVLILFGYNKFPEMMKNLANGINIFKNEIKETKDATSAVVQRQSEKVAARRRAASPTPATKKRAPAKKSVKK